MRNEGKLYSTEELTNRFRISRFAVTRAIKSGELVVTEKIGNSNYFSEEAIDAFLERSREKYISQGKK